MKLHRFVLAAVIALTEAGLSTSAVQAAVTHPIAHTVVSDFPDGSPDVVTIEPDITARPMCESSFPNYCARDTNNSGSSGSVIFEGSNTPGPAENLKFHPNGSTFTWNGHAYHVGTLEFSGHPGLCVGSPGADVVTASCSTGTGTIWGHGHSGNGDVWISRVWTQSFGSLQVLGAFGFAGDEMEVFPWANPDAYKRWSF
jgi:hypothetical protein